MKFKHVYGLWKYTRHVKSINLDITVDLGRLCHALYRIGHRGRSRNQAAYDVLGSERKDGELTAYVRVISSVMGAGHTNEVMSLLKQAIEIMDDERKEAQMGEEQEVERQIEMVFEEGL